MMVRASLQFTIHDSQFIIPAYRQFFVDVGVLSQQAGSPSERELSKITGLDEKLSGAGERS
jgi:hypothetical protein